MDKQELIALAERVEKLEGPNYAMEIEIFKALHPEYADYVQGRGGLVHPCDGSDVRVLSDVRPPNYTASIDAAMTLIPDGYMLNRLSDIAADGLNLCELVSPGKPDAVSFGTASHATAICAAALRALSQKGPHDGR